MKIGIREAKARLSHYIHEVQSGKIVTITVHGRPIAVLAPHGGPSRTASKLKNLVGKGILSQAGYKPCGLAHPPRLRKPNALSSVIIEGRE